MGLGVRVGVGVNGSVATVRWGMLLCVTLQQAATTESPVLWQTFVRRDFGMWAEPARSIINVEVRATWESGLRTGSLKLCRVGCAVNWPKSRLVRRRG